MASFVSQARVVERDASVGLRSSRAEPPEGVAASPVAELRGRRLFLARMGWAATALFVVGLFVAAVPAGYGEIADLSNLPAGIDSDALRENLSEAGISAGTYAMFRVGMEVGFALVCLALAAAIFWRRSEEPVALFVSLLLVLLGTTFWGSLQMFASVHPAWRPVVYFLDALGIVSLFLFFYLFPDGRFVPRWTRWLAAAALAHVALMTLFPASPLNPDNFPVPVFLAFLAGMLLTGMFAQVYRYRRVSGRIQRQQTKWVVFGFTAAIGGFLGAILFAEVVFSLAEPGTAGDVIGYAVITSFMLLIPLSIGVAIMRHRLFDIDFVINRALVYGMLTACVVGVYVLVVGYLGALFRVEDNLLVSLIATGIVAVTFAPLRARLQRQINRLVYGERDDPYKVISRLGERMEATIAPEAILPTIARTIREALKLPYATISLRDKSGATIAATEDGEPPKGVVRLPLSHHGEEVGEMTLAPRPGEAGFSPADRRLLEDLARQAGAAAHAVRLTKDLQRSRERLVTTREEERRRLRRDLHDGLGSTLGSLPMKLDVASDMISADPEAAKELLRSLKKQTRSATSDVRRLVHELRPPALDELGLAGAVREVAARQNGLRIALEAPDELFDLPAAVEVAAYRIAGEAMTNVVRHADANRCEVRLALDDGSLRLEISDDGRGIGENRGSGVGLHSMRERAEELGGTFEVGTSPEGGARIHASLPLAESKG